MINVQALANIAEAECLVRDMFRQIARKTFVVTAFEFDATEGTYSFFASIAAVPFFLLTLQKGHETKPRPWITALQKTTHNLTATLLIVPERQPVLDKSVDNHRMDTLLALNMDQTPDAKDERSTGS